jgi:2-dehydropantoate 2-reductase
MGEEGMTLQKMKVAVMGAGAVGGYLGAFLQKGGLDVTLIARGEHLQAIRENGLHVIGERGEFIVPIKATDDITQVGPVDLILFTVKSYDTREVAEQIIPYLHQDTTVITFQNGVDNEEILAEVLGEQRIMSGVAYISAKVESPGVIRQLGVDKFVIGERDGSDSVRGEFWLQQFQSCGIDSKLSPSIIATKWEKLLWNVTFNPISALTYAKAGEVTSNPNLRAVAERVLDEVVAVGRSQGIHLREKVIQGIIPSGEVVGNHKTSMLQDREKGKRMEVESICGYLVRKGRELGVATPTIATLYDALSFVNEGTK